MLDTLSSTVFLTAMSVWLGGVVFFSFFTAPVIFERLPRNQAADLISVIFPRYYNLGYVCGTLMIISGFYPVWLEPTGKMAWLSWGLAFLATALSAYAGKVVMPRVRRHRQTAASSAGTAEHPRNLSAYNRSHQLSVTLNSTVLILLITQALIYGYRVRFIVTGEG
ncbi:MAG TPA: DUF4149 domain-containing protein [Planctomycetes bacterium]|nr:DUF4149 domain-containing protein [Planctomycetota bacterium]